MARASPAACSSQAGSDEVPIPIRQRSNTDNLFRGADLYSSVYAEGRRSFFQIRLWDAAAY